MPASRSSSSLKLQLATKPWAQPRCSGRTARSAAAPLDHRILEGNERVPALNASGPGPERTAPKNRAAESGKSKGSSLEKTEMKMFTFRTLVDPETLDGAEGWPLNIRGS
ncbi:unnamed protein product [Effrenium voratum]|nr:unnamed protein product [Effrenium voratum]